MSEILTPGERPSVWGKLGDLARRVARLEAVPPGTSGGSGIQFDTYPQTGGTLDTETSGNTSLTTVGNGADFFITTNSAVGSGTIQLYTQQLGDIQLHVSDGFLQLLCDSDDGISVECTDAAGFVEILSAGSVSLQASSGEFRIIAYGPYVLEAHDDATVYLATAGKSLTVLDSSGNPIFQVDEDGDLHGKTGKALTFDL